MSSIHWIDGEIRARVNDAQLAIESFARQPEQLETIANCVELIHQIGGALKILNAHGTLLLVDEMEKLAAGFANASVPASESAIDALMRGMADLLHHLDALGAGSAIDPNAMLQVVNDLRGARGEVFVDARVLFRPDLWVELSIDSARRRRLQSDPQRTLRRMRVYYQRALLLLLRGEAKGLSRIDAVVEKMEELSAGRARARLWWSARGIVEALQCGQLELTSAVRKLLTQLDMEFRGLIEKGPGLLDRRPSGDLLRHILYYVACAEAGGERCQAICQGFGLERPTGDFSGETSGGLRKPAALSALARPLMEQIAELKKSIHDAQDREQVAELRAGIAERVVQLSDMLGILGLDPLRRVLRAHAERVASQDDEHSGDHTMLQMAGALIDAESVVQALQASGDPGTGSEESIARLRRQRLIEATLAEINADIFQSKESLSRYVGMPEAVDVLAELPQRFKLISGAARFIGMPYMAELLLGWGRYIQDAVVARGEPLETALLEELAQAIVEIDSIIGYSGVNDKGDSALQPLLVAVPAFEGERVEEPEIPATPIESYAPPPMLDDPVRPACADSRDVPEFVDEELMEIFAEEMQEVIESLEAMVPDWSQGCGDAQRLQDIRRGFHTLKGSGRVVGANEIGELAWSVERILNRVIDGTLAISPGIVAVVSEITAALPELKVAYLENRSMAEATQLIAKAEALSG